MKNFSKPYTQGYNFDMNGYIKGAWAKLNAGMGPYIGVTILFVVISILVSFIPLVNIVSGVIQSMLTAGFFIYSSRQQEGRAQFNDFFGGFNFALPIFLYSLVYLAILIPGFLILFGFAFPIEEIIALITSGGNDPEMIRQLGDSYFKSITSGSGLAAIIVAAVYFLYFGISYVLVIPLIVNAKMDFWSAMETSRRTISKNFIPALIMNLLLGIGIAAAIIVTCGIGMLFAFPFIYLVYNEMYEQIYTDDLDASENDNLIQEA